MKSLSMKRTTTIAALFALTCAVPAHALNYAATGVVAKLFNYTDLHSNGSTNGVTMIQLSTPLEGGCIWGFLAPADKNALAIILAAKAEGSTVKLTYDSAAASPWGATNVCAVIGIEVS